MKPHPFRNQSTPSALPGWLWVLAIGFPVVAPLNEVRALNVDSEIVLLVDITKPGLTENQFDLLMDGYANAFTSGTVIDSIQSGYYGRVAVSMMFYGNTSTQLTGIPWMAIGSLSQAEQFAVLARSMTMPLSNGQADVGAALTAAAQSFGTETGGTANGFESVVQMVEVATSKSQANNTAGPTSIASAAALASGVDLINSLALGNQANKIDDFYTANVIGSTLPGVTPTSTTSPIDSALAGTINTMFSETTQIGAEASVNAVPEPSALFGLIPATLLLMKRRRN